MPRGRVLKVFKTDAAHSLRLSLWPILSQDVKNCGSILIKESLQLGGWRALNNVPFNLNLLSVFQQCQNTLCPSYFS